MSAPAPAGPAPAGPIPAGPGAAVLHLRCGSDIRDALSVAGLVGGSSGGDFLEWADPVCQGPVRDLPEADYLAERRAWLSAAWDIPQTELDAKLLPVSALLERAAGYAEVCMWFEHDLYDQSMLVQLLASFTDAALREKVRLVSVDRHPSVKRFIGFGQLRPEAFAPLYAQRRPLSPWTFELARDVWAAYREPSPLRLRRTLASGAWANDELPFLPAALARHLDELPAPGPGEGPGLSGGLGLGLLQRLSLQAIAEAHDSQGAAFAAQIFGQLMSALDPAPWVGDLMYWAYLRELAHGPRALITMLGDFPSEQLEPTALGRAVLAGEAPWLEPGQTPPADGPSRWRGGVEISS